MSLWRTKSLQFIELEANSGQQKLERTLGPFSLILLGIGAIVGAGLFSVTGIAAANNAGPAITLAFILAAIGCAFTGLCLSELAAMMPVAGGAYSYTYATLGELIAWVVGWLLILQYGTGAITVAISWSGYVISFLQGINIHLPIVLTASPWQPTELLDGSIVYGWINLPALVIVLLLSSLLICGVEKSSKVNNALVVVKMSVVFIFIAVGVFYITPSNYTPFVPQNQGSFGEFGWSGVMRASGIVFLAYIGFDAVATTAQEVKNPQKSLPIGIIGSLIVCTVIYVLFSAVLVGLVPYLQLNVSAPVATAVNQTPFSWLNGLIKLAIIAGLTSVVLVMMLALSRIFLAMSKDGLLPGFLSVVHPKFHTPWISSLLVMIVVGLFAAFAPLEMMGQLSSIGTLFIFVIVCASVIVLRKSEPEANRPFKTPLVPFIPMMGMGICSLLMLSLGVTTWAYLMIWILIGLLIYFTYSRQKSHLAKLEKAEESVNF